MYTDGVNMKDNNFFSQNEFHSEMFFQHSLYLKTCTLLLTPLSLVYGLCACENVDDCERPLTLIDIYLLMNVFIFLLTHF